MTPHRVVYWNIPNHEWMYLPFAILVIVFGYGVYRRVRVWRLGQRRPGDNHRPSPKGHEEAYPLGTSTPCPCRRHGRRTAHADDSGSCSRDAP